MKKRYYFSIIVGMIFALLISPGVFLWLGYPTPSERIANMFTAILGPPSFTNGIIAFSIAGVLIFSIILGMNKMIKRV